MTNLTATPGLDDVYQLETTDLALAGTSPSQIMNKQAQSLLNRTAYLDAAVIAAARTIPKQVANFTAIRALDKNLDAKIVYLDGVGIYALDAADTTSADNGGMIIVATDGGRWKFLSHTTVTNQAYQEFGAVNQRIADRFFVGGAVKNNGKNETVQLDWLTIYQIAKGRSNGFIQSAQISFLTSESTDVSNCLIAASKTSNLHDNYNSIGVLGIAVADKTTGTGHAYAGYYEAYREVGVAGGAYGIEIDTINYASYTAIDPYVQLAGQVIGLQLASGGEYSPVGQFDASAALNIQKNGSKFGLGIIFGADSITGTDGVTGTGVAIAFAKGHMQQWYSATGQLTSSILGACATPALSLDQSFVDGQVRWRDKSSKNVLQVVAAPSGVNYISIRNAISGSPAQIFAAGDDANINLYLSPQGTAGEVQAALGNFAVITAGKGLRVKEGSNAKQGVATLSAGSVVVLNTSVTATSRVMLTSQQDGGTVGFVRVSARTPGVSFTITSSSGTDTSIIAYQIFEPA